MENLDSSCSCDIASSQTLATTFPKFSVLKFQEFPRIHLLISNSSTAALTVAKEESGSETILDFLEEGESATLRAGTYFYITTK